MNGFIEDDPAKSDAEQTLQGKQRYCRGQGNKAKTEKEGCQRASQCHGSQDVQARHAGKGVCPGRVPCYVQAAEANRHLHKEIKADGKQRGNGRVLRLQKAVLDRKKNRSNRHISYTDSVMCDVLGMVAHAEP